MEDGGAVSLANRLARIEAQANVVVAPHAHRLHVLKQGNRFLDPPAHLENVAQHYEAVGPMLLQHVDGLSQLIRLLVDVRQQPQLHRLPSTFFFGFVEAKKSRMISGDEDRPGPSLCAAMRLIRKPRAKEKRQALKLPAWSEEFTPACPR
jgi:hypothetical protein